jgi:hypothetical protein
MSIRDTLLTVKFNAHVTDWNPPVDPATLLTDQEMAELAERYMGMWCREREDFPVEAVLYERGEIDACARELVSSGAIDSDNCYPNCASVERIIEGWANRKRAIKRALKGCTVYTCNGCNTVSYVDFTNGYPGMSEQELDAACLECGDKPLKKVE